MEIFLYTKVVESDVLYGGGGGKAIKVRKRKWRKSHIKGIDIKEKLVYSKMI